MREKGWEERGPKAHSKNSDFSTPLIWVLFSGLPNFGATPPGTGGGGARCDTKIFRQCSATPVLHLQNAIKSRKSAATRVARHV